MPRTRYQGRPTQNNPSIEISEAMLARIVFAAEEVNVAPGLWLEKNINEALRVHGLAMEDREFETVCKQAERNRTFAPTRHEFDRHRPKRRTDPK